MNDQIATQSVALASLCSSILVTFACNPFDVIKNYTQAGTHYADHRNQLSFPQVTRYIYQTKGISAFWAGIIPALCYTLPSNVIFFQIYERLKKEERAGYSAMKARFLSVLLTSPIELARTRSQVSLGEINLSSVFRKVVSQEGYISLWRGLLPSLVRDLPFSAVYWELCEYMRDKARNQRHQLPQAINFIVPFGIGMSAGMIATIISQPLDVIKTLIQSTSSSNPHAPIWQRIQNREQLNVIRKYIETNGGYRKAFFVGLTPRILRVPISCAITLGVFDRAITLFKKFE